MDDLWTKYLELNGITKKKGCDTVGMTQINRSTRTVHRSIS